MNVPLLLLDNMTNPWPFLMWGIDIIGEVTPKASNGRWYILVAIDYFTKWVEAESYSSVNTKSVIKFIKRNIIYQYRVPYELISDHGSHYQGELCKLLENFKIMHHKSDPYWPETNGTVDAANKNMKTIIRKMTDNYKDWAKKLPLTL